MASRISLGRIIEWAENTDLNELDYVAGRLLIIQKKRMDRVAAADQHGGKKRKRLAKTQKEVPGTLDTLMEMASKEKAKVAGE